MIVKTLLLPSFFLLGFSILIAVRTALKGLSPEEKFSKSSIHFFFLRRLENLFKPNPLREFLNVAIVIALIGYGASGTLFLATSNLTFGLLSLLLIALTVYFLFNFFATHLVVATLKLFSLIASFYLILFFPLIYPLLWLDKKLSPSPIKNPTLSRSEQLKHRLLELLEEAEMQNLHDPMETKLVSSLAQFGDRVAREIMIPRPDMLCLPESTIIYDSLKMFIQEGYSRIPLYRDSIDDVTSVLLYKDVMEFCVDAMEKNDLALIRKTTVSSLATELLFSPENKKIRDLFQEMRTKKIHASIVVNEYGCTEGLITIEDILEELVGSEIQDEHDEGEESPYKETLDKSWIVDATMSIIDVEKELGIELPHGPEYETIAGFISLQAGCIPKPGTLFHGDNFHIEVLKSDERQILEVKITPVDQEPLDL